MTTWTARCQCGTQGLTSDAAPQVVAFCHCGDCRRWTDRGAPKLARFGYLPGRFYVPVGVLDDAESLSPDLHRDAGNALPGQHIAAHRPRLKRATP